MPDKPHWSSLRRNTAALDHPLQLAYSKETPANSRNVDRRLTLGDASQWTEEGEPPARSLTLGDVGDWFKNKLPKWNDFGRLKVGKKRAQKIVIGGAELRTHKGEERGKQEGRHMTRVQSFTAAIQKSQSVLKVLEAKKNAKRRAREERESMRESGDYLGVQGINPQTGVLDLTSDSGESIFSFKTEQKLRRLEVRAKNASSPAEKKEAEIEIVKVHLDQDVKKLRNLERTKKQLALPSTGKWRRGTHQWSSVQEPDLSPVAQSHRNLSTFSGPLSHQSHDMAEGELIDLSPPFDHENSKEILHTELLLRAHGRETSHSSNTVIRTPHRRSFTNLPLGALELFENDITFHPSDEHKPERDFFADPTTKPFSSDEKTQATLLKAKSVQAIQEAQTSSRRQAGIKSGPLHLKEAERSASRDPLTALSHPKRDTTITLESQHRARAIQEIQANEEIVGESLLRLDKLQKTTPKIRDHSDNHIWVENAKPNIEDINQVKGASASTNITIITGQLRSFSRESWNEYIAEIGVLERNSSDRYYVGELPSACKGKTTGASIQQRGTTDGVASSTAPMQQFVNIHLYSRRRRHQNRRDKARDSPQGRHSAEQRSTSISDIPYRAQKPNDGTGDVRAQQSSKTSERRRRRRRSFQ
ncbi:hypothetical protein FGRMN_4296 [Fusarium graminum]|nr:hypothetical protein FGRMN_4296 [Fusarium graminum]